MNEGMQNYLTTIAIKTKVENFKEFDKSKDETTQALMKNFQLSKEDAVIMVEKFWDNDPFKESKCASSSLTEKYQFLIEEKDRKMKEYDLKIAVVKDAINGYSIETIARQKGLSIERVRDILD